MVDGIIDLTKARRSMILQALYHYYEILQNDPDVDIARPGYCIAPISHALNLSPRVIC
jgi:hypothetical protein